MKKKNFRLYAVVVLFNRKIIKVLELFIKIVPSPNSFRLRQVILLFNRIKAQTSTLAIGIVFRNSCVTRKKKKKGFAENGQQWFSQIYVLV